MISVCRDSDQTIKVDERLSRFSYNSGFTFVELLIVIIVIGILSAIALPSFLNQAKKGRQSEAKVYIGSMNRAHQADYLERGTFTTNLGDLGIGIATETSAYIYRITPGVATGSGIVNRAIPSDGSFSNTPDLQSTFSSYLGGVKVGSLTATGSAVGTMSVLCEALFPPINPGGDLGDVTEPSNLLSYSPGPPTCEPSVYEAVN